MYGDVYAMLCSNSWKVPTPTFPESSRVANRARPNKLSCCIWQAPEHPVQRLAGLDTLGIQPRHIETPHILEDDDEKSSEEREEPGQYNCIRGISGSAGEPTTWSTDTWSSCSNSRILGAVFCVLASY